jgi:hypothetical protein
MPNDGEGQVLTRGELLRNLRAIENLSVHNSLLSLQLKLGPLIAAVENGPIVEDLDAEVMETTRATFDLSASRDETCITIVARIERDCQVPFVRARISQAFEDLLESGPDSRIDQRIY